MTEEILKDTYFKQITDPVTLMIHTLPDQAFDGVAGNLQNRFIYPNQGNPHRILIPGAPVGGTQGIAADISNVPLGWYDEDNATGLLDRAMASLNRIAPVGGIPRVNTPNAPITFAVPGNPYVLQFQNDNQRDNFLTFVRGDFQLRFAHDAQAAGFSYSMFDTVGPFSLMNS